MDQGDSDTARQAELRHLLDSRRRYAEAHGVTHPGIGKRRSQRKSSAWKTGDFYLSFMDEAAIEGKGISPLKSEFDAIAAIKDRRQLAEFIGGHLRADVDPLNNTNFETDNLFGVWISQGLTDPEHNVPYL